MLLESRHDRLVSEATGGYSGYERLNSGQRRLIRFEDDSGELITLHTCRLADAPCHMSGKEHIGCKTLMLSRTGIR